MSIMNQPGGFKFDFGSTVTILTTAAAGAEHGKNFDSLGVFTGIVLDEAKLKLKRTPKHVSISVDGLEETYDGDYCKNEYKPDKDKEDEWDKDCKDKDHDDWHKDCKDKDHDEWDKDCKDKDHDDWHKDCKDKDHDDWHKDCKDKDHDDWHKDCKDKDHDDWHKDCKDKDHDDWHKDCKDKDHDHGDKDCKDKDYGKKHHPVEVKKEEEFLVLSLTCPSFPFTAGQLVWVNIEQIVALAVVCRN